MLKAFFIACSVLICALFFFPSTAKAVDCNADINQDTIIDLSDFGLLVKNFFKSASIAGRSDINHDGIVDVSDYGILVKNFFAHCPIATATVSPSATPKVTTTPTSTPSFTPAPPITSGTGILISTDELKKPPNCWRNRMYLRNPVLLCVECALVCCE
jgi:hypothetical protein